MVILFWEEHGVTVEAMLTDNEREYCGTDRHPHEVYLALVGIEHPRIPVGDR